MAQPKRARPAFSPPRPTNKAKSKATTKSTSTSTKSTSKPKPRTKPSTTKITKNQSKGASSKAAPKPKRLFDDMADADDDDDDENEDEEMDVDEDAELLSLDSDSDNHSNSNEEDNSNEEEVDEENEPDFILAEITSSKPSSDTELIPQGLLHHILRSHWKTPNETRITKDAREVVAKYVEVFAREAIMRTAYEKNSRDDGDGDDGEDDEDEERGREKNKTGDGWLEVEDLEKIAVQLCFDF